jgi:hypothetical protein
MCSTSIHERVRNWKKDMGLAEVSLTFRITRLLRGSGATLEQVGVDAPVRSHFFVPLRTTLALVGVALR